MIREDKALERKRAEKALEKESFSRPCLFKCPPRDRAIETRGVERHFKTGIDLQLVSGMGIEQNSQGFIACTLHVLCMDYKEPRVIDSVVSSSLPGFSYELCSMLNHSLYTKPVNSFPGHCAQCLLYHA